MRHYAARALHLRSKVLNIERLCSSDHSMDASYEGNWKRLIAQAIQH
jgi:hypothetical protein